MTVAKQRNKIPFLCGIKTYVLAEKCFGNLCLGLAVDKLKIMMRPQHFNYNYFAQIRASLVLIMWTDFLLTIYICLTSLTRAKPKEKNEICHSISTRAIKCDGVFFVLQHSFQYGFQHA